MQNDLYIYIYIKSIRVFLIKKFYDYDQIYRDEPKKWNLQTNGSTIFFKYYTNNFQSLRSNLFWISW